MEEEEEEEEVRPTGKARKSAEPPGGEEPDAGGAQPWQGSATPPVEEAPAPAAADPLTAVLGHSTRLGPVLRATWAGSQRSYLSHNVGQGLRLAAVFFADRATEGEGKELQIGADGVLSAFLMSRPGESRWAARLIDTLNAHEFGAAEVRVREHAKAESEPDEHEPDDVLLRWDAVRLLHHASALRRETNPGNETIGVRHIWLAALFLREGQMALESLGLMERGLPALIEALAETVGAEAVSGYGDDPRVWQEVIAGARLQPLLIETRRLQSGFSPDVVADDGAAAAGGRASDPLGTRADAVALADLILLDSAKPPLAVGLLGSWGSGKSTLMWRLREEIQRQIEAAQNQAEPAEPAAETRRVRNVAQLTFNAWSFADSTNLWASLTAEIFEQLKAGGSDALRGERGEALVREVAGKLAAHEAQAAAGPSAAGLQSELDELETKARRKGVEAEAAQLHAVTVAQLITGDATAFEDRLKRALPGDEDAIAMDAHGQGLGRSWWLAKRMYPGWLRAAPIVAALALAAGVAALIFVPDLRETWGVVATAAAPILAALVLIGKPVVTALGAAARYDELVHRRKVKLAGEATELQSQVEAKKAELDRARQEEERRATTVATLAETKGHPARLLQYLLSESADIQSIKAQVGLMATVRRCFETLDELIKRHLRVARAEAARDDKGNEGKTVGKATPPIERIILYIDDLDRCSADQVVKVLEAVHLLLAFECFVVIVAIDARWLHRSLLISHPQFKRAAERKQADAGGDEASAEGGLPSPSDYLEKIFQIPFWVRTLRPPVDDSHDAPRANPYTRYLDTLLGRRPDGGGEDGKDEARSGDMAAGGAEALMPMPPDAPETPGDDLRTRRERVTLSTDERDLLDNLGPLAARSPRAIKRLVNIYRLIKAGVPQAHAAAFEGRGSGDIASFASILFVLALDAGLPAETVAAIRLALERISRANWASYADNPDYPFYFHAGVPSEENSDPHLAGLIETLTNAHALDEFVAGLTALRKQRGDALDQDDLLRAFAMTQRYSFRAS